MGRRRMSRLDTLRRRLIGSPLPTSAHHEERYSNAEALAILSSDALSSVAYATQEIVLVLGMGGAAALPFTLPITGLIVALMLVVASSYRQTIKAYPHGGGSYRVSRQNLGQTAGLVAGASLSIDYVLTVAVSVAAGIAALTSYVPILAPERVPLCLLAVLLVMLANLRGVSSSARFLSLPTFLFMGAVVTLVVAGFIKTGLGQLPPAAGGAAAAAGRRPPGQPGPAGHWPRAADAGLQLRLRRPHRHRGDQRQCRRFQAGGMAQRPSRPGGDGADAGPDVQRYQRPGQPGRAGGGGQRAHAALSAGGADLRGWPAVVRAAAGDAADPAAGCQHRLCGFPPAGRFPGPGRLPAPPAVLPGRPAGVQQRHLCPQRPRRPVAGDRRRQRQPPDPSVCRGCVHQFHPVPGRDGGALVEAAGPGLALPGADQRHRSRDHRRGGRDPSDQQVHPWGLGGGGGDPPAGAAVSTHSQPLRRRGQASAS